MALAYLPYITSDLPGIGGEIKLKPDHFIVEERPLYEPSGVGDHVFVRLTREGQTTQQLVKDIAQALEIKPQTIGYAGLKDRYARSTQILSIPGVQPEQALALGERLDVLVHWAVPHNKKLRPGHLLGNQFTIVVLNPNAEEALTRALAIRDALLQRGLPNYFGEQRFGKYGDNAEQGLAILTGRQKRPRAKWLHKLLASAYQSQLFNNYLAVRIQRGLFDRILDGDLAKKTDTGGMFLVEEAEIEQLRLDRKEITYTGPLFGYKMRRPEGAAAALEAEIESECPVTEGNWRKHRVEGNRRAGRLMLEEIEITPHPQGLNLRFYLPKGAYATVLLREIMKNAVASTDAAADGPSRPHTIT